MKTQNAKKQKMIKYLIIIAAVCVMAAVLMFAIDTAQGCIGVNSQNEENVYFFYPPDYEENIFENEEYMGKDRNIKLKKGGMTVSYTLENFGKMGEMQGLIADYLSALINGDEDSVNAMYSEEYLKENDKLGDITMQKIYNIEAEDLGNQDVGHEKTVYFCKLTYMIMENDGTFRRDLDSDAERPVYLEIVSDGDGIKINAIGYFYNVQ